MDQQGVPPWHLWGSEQTVVVPASGATTNSGVSSQLARIGYKRPDTWTFFFYAQILAAQPSGPTSAVFIAYDLTLGTGRSSTTIPGFANFQATWTVAPPIGLQLYTSTVPNVVNNTGTPATDSPGQISFFPAQDIQLTARVVIPATQAGVTVTVAAYFAPRTHVRPDWEQHEFAGELKGH